MKLRCGMLVSVTIPCLGLGSLDMHVTHTCRYFHDMPEKADQEQLANVTEMLRVMTYSRGWQGVDGPPDPDSRPFADWDGATPHWRGDARRAEEERNKNRSDNNNQESLQNATAGSSGRDGEEANEGESDTEAGGLEDNVIHVTTVDDAEVLPPEQVLSLLCLHLASWLSCPFHGYCLSFP